MTQIQSKLVPITTTCIEYVHPWTDKCCDATAGLMLHASQESLRIYSVVYIVSLLMRGRTPVQKDILQTIRGILQSSAFLSTNAFTYSMFLCILRRWVRFNFLNVAFIPAFMASFFAIIIERKSRRTLLTLYVSNVATEVYWKMATSRGMVRPIRHGNVLVFGISTAILTYYYRNGLHNLNKDSLFNILRYVLGPQEEYNYLATSQPATLPSTQPQLPIQQPSTSSAAISAPSQSTSSSSVSSHFNRLLASFNEILQNLNIIKRHKSCPHQNDCLSYTICGSSKLFLIGIGLQSALKLVLNIQRIIQKPSNINKIFFNRDTLKLGLFLGEFSALFRFCSCLMRNIIGKDSPWSAIPAGLIASTAFSNYPDNSIALYIMWKMLHITYNIGIEKGILPKVPGFTIFLYCFSTATLFHAATLEPNNMRPSYWKFLHRISGSRICQMDRKSFDVWGLETSKNMFDVMKRTRTDVLQKL